MSLTLSLPSLSIQQRKARSAVIFVCALSFSASMVLATTGSILAFAAILGGVLVLTVIFMRPIIGMYLTVASIPLELAGKIGELMPSINLTYTKIFALASMLVWLFQLLMRKMPLVWTKDMWLFLLYVIACVLSLPDALEFKRGLQEMMLVLTTFVFFLMVINFFTTRDRLNTVLILFAIVSVMAFSYAIVQRFLPGTEIKERIGWLEKGEATYGLETSSIESKSIGIVQRSTGTSAHSNVLAANTAFLVPVLFGFMKLSKSLKLKALLWLGFFISVAAAVESLSRTGMLTYLIVMPLLLYTKFFRITLPGVTLWGLIFIICIPFLPEGVSRIFDVSNYVSNQSVSVSERLKLWDAAIRAFIDHPLNGFGIGNNRGIFDYYSNPWNPGLLTVHCSYLQIAIETGILGLGAMSIFLRQIFKNFLIARTNFKQTEDEWGYTFSTALLISFVSFLIMGAIAFDFSRIGFKNIWFFMGASVILCSLSRNLQDVK